MKKYYTLLISIFFSITTQADVIGAEKGLKFKIVKENSTFKYVLVDANNNAKWESHKFSSRDYDLNDTSIGPMGGVEDLNVGLAVGTISIYDSGSGQYRIGPTPMSGFPLDSQFNTGQVTILAATARSKNPVNELIQSYRSKVSTLQEQLQNCKSRGTADEEKVKRAP